MCEVSRDWCLLVKNDRCATNRRLVYITRMRTDPIARKVSVIPFFYSVTSSGIMILTMCRFD